jgi:hypothetical protein
MRNFLPRTMGGCVGLLLVIARQVFTGQKDCGLRVGFTGLRL